MAGNIKGITIEFRGDTTSLDKALRKITTETKNIDKELKQVDKALKFNPTNVDLWRQKQQLLTQKVAETREKLALLKQEQARMDAEGVDKNSEEYRKLQREIITTESQVKTFEGQLKKVGNVNMRAASESVKQLGNNLTAAGEAMRGLSMAGAAVVGVLGAMTVKSGQLADDINTLSKKYNISTQDLQMYSLAAEQVDVSVEDIAKTHVKLEKSMASAAKGTGSQAEAFKKLGVAVTDENGNLRDADEVWQETISKLGEMTNETERDALAQQLLGKAAANLNPLIEDGGETYKRVAELFKKYNLELVDQETLDKANKFNDSLDDIKSMGTLAFSMIGAELAGQLLPVMEKVVNVVGKIAGWLGNLNPKVLAVIGAIAGVVAVLAPMLLVAGKIAFAISSIMSLMATLGVSFAALAGPVGIVIAVIAALVAIGIVLYKNWDKIKAKAKDLKDKISTAFKSIKDTVSKVWESVKQVTSTVWNAIKTVVETVVKFVYTLIQARFQLIQTVATTIFKAIETVITVTWNAIKKVITVAITAIQTLITARFQLIQTVITTSLNAVKTIVTTVWNAIKTVITTVVNAIYTLITSKFTQIQQSLTATFNTIKTMATNAWNGIKSAITSVVTSIHSAVTSKISAISSSMSSTFNSIKNTATSVWNSISSAITSPISKAKDTISGIIKKIKGFFPFNVGKIINFTTPHISLKTASKSVLGKTITYPTGFNVDWYAKGGIFTSPTIIPNAGVGLGEAGPEAVLPIDKLREMVDFGNQQGMAIMEQQTRILMLMYEEMQKEKNFKIDNVFAGRYINSFVKV